ncbi:MAG: hypothetical protein COW30_00885 [Rhodospirillales bacterium CG15_BIG_FIL_POST_REV_8_21_14_020_66_15]|nr:MAG: hypothetical protein COW30_00885 [Rhodospirillales bacterium CG15_BIG_FIL_POST_REV_8_21_14_020_66_15]
MTLALILSGALTALMAAVEVLRFRRVRRFTFLTAAHALIAVGYCLPAFLIAFLPGTPWAAGMMDTLGPNPWGVRLYILDLADALNLAEGAYVSAGIILGGGYAVMLGGYLLAARRAPMPLQSRAIPAGGLAVIGLVLGAMAALALTAYAFQFDGLRDMAQAGLDLRRGARSVRWGALQVLAQIAFPAFLILAAAALRFDGWRRAVLAAAAAAIWAVAAVRLLHVGGRLDTAGFLVTPLLAWVFVARSRVTAMAVLAGLGALALFLASVDPAFFRDPVATAGTEAKQLTSALADNVLYILAYLGFPHITAAHALTVSPGVIDFRWFIDIPLGVAYMLPNFTGVETLPPMILSLHVKLLPWIPVDLFSFGYYSLGTLGVLIVFAAFGAVLALFDGWLTESPGWLGQALRAAWLFYLPFRLLYADPYAALQAGFGLIAGTVVILALSLWARRWA